MLCVGLEPILIELMYLYTRVPDFIFKDNSEQRKGKAKNAASGESGQAA